MYKRNAEGIHIINLAKTWEKLMVAARIIAAIPNPSDVLVSTEVNSLCLPLFLGTEACKALPIKSVESSSRVVAITGYTACKEGNRNHVDILTRVFCPLDRLQQRVRPESRPQVRHLHQGQVLGWQVDPRYPYQSEHQEVRFSLPILY